VAGSEPISVRYAVEGEVATVGARWILDCSGRAGVLAKRGLRRFGGGRATVALVGTWRREGGWGLEAESHTLVESYHDGWAWSVPVSPTTRYFTAMIDPRVTETEGAKNVAPIYRAELAKTRHIGPLLHGATTVESPWACSASSYSAATFGGKGFLLVGDAASFIDPLSSFGVKKALASAWLAAVVVHTCLESPRLTGPAVSLFDRREREMHEAYRRLSATFSLEAGRRHAHDFWVARAEGIDELDPGGLAGETDVAALRGAPDVVAAFERLRGSERIGLRVSDTLSTTRSATVEGRRVVLEERIVAPGLDGVRFLRRVDLVSLMNLAPRRSTVPDLYELYCAECAPVILPDFLGALSVLIAKGVLEEA
jgi:flavin-dependent dehydrogenase